jgi:hypothetical protein
MPIGTPLQLVTRIDTKFGQIDDALATKASAPIDGGAFVPTQIDLSIGAVEHDFYQQTGPITFGLNAAKTPVLGGSVSVNIRGATPAAAVTFPSNFVGVDGLTSGTVLTSGQSYPFYIRFAPDWVETSPGSGIFEDRILIGALGITAAGGGLIATPIKTAAYVSAVGEAVRTNTAGGSFPVEMPAGAAEGATVAQEDNSPTSWSANNYVHLHTTDGAGFIREDTGAIHPGDFPDNGVKLDGGNSALWRKTSGNWKYIGQTGLMGGDHGTLTGLGDNDHPQYALVSRLISTQQGSLAGGGDLSADLFLSLSGDVASPGANQVYGTNSSGMRGWKADPATAAAEPFRSTQTAAAVTLETILAVGLVSNRHNTLIELTGTVDQEVDLAGLTANAIAVITDNNSNFNDVGVTNPRLRVLKGDTDMRIIGHPDDAWNPRHMQAYIVPWGAAHVEHEHATPLTRVSGAITQLPPGVGTNPTDLSAATIDFDINAAGKLAFTPALDRVRTWTDTLGQLANSPTQATDLSCPLILGVPGEKDYRADFNTTALPRVWLQNTVGPQLPATGFTMYFVGGMGTTVSVTTGHSFGVTADHNVGMRITSGTEASCTIDTLNTASAPIGGLNDFAWRDNNKFIFLIILNADSTVISMGFHERGGAERRGTSLWGTPVALATTGIRLGASAVTGGFGFLQQFGAIPRALTETEGWSVLRYLRLKWMD